jgi:hypothetical protein
LKYDPNAKLNPARIPQMKRSSRSDEGIALVVFLLFLAGLPFKPKVQLKEENAAFRHPLVILMRKLHCRVRVGVDFEEILAHNYSPHTGG